MSENTIPTSTNPLLNVNPTPLDSSSVRTARVADVKNRVYDYSTLALWQTCQRKWQYVELEELESLTTPSALTFGNAYHLAMESYSLDRNVNKAILKGLLRLSELNHVVDEKRSPETLEKIIRAYAQHYPAVAGACTHCGENVPPDPLTYIKNADGTLEIEFHIPMKNGAILAGRMDGIVTFQGGTYVLERKTRWTLGSHLVESFTPNLQVDIYTYAARTLIGRCDGALVDVALVAKTKQEFARLTPTRTDEQLQEFEHNFYSLVDEIETAAKRGYYIQNFGSCVDFGSVCMFRDICLYGMRAVDVDGRYKRRTHG